jgi:phage repressor protein C with HTH and peptisase S24 domain
MQASFATRSTCYAFNMNEIELAQLRIDLLRAAMLKVTATPEKPDGNRTDFGRRLGYKDGAFVRQMLSGEKPVTEKTIRKIEAIPGLAGWFTGRPELASAGAPATVQHENTSSDLTITDQTRDLIKRLLPEDKGNVFEWEEEGDLPEDATRVWVDRYDYHFSAGNGLIQWEVREKHSLPFTQSFFKAKGARPKDCKLLMLRGDSMEPWAEDKNMIMVDTSSTRIMDGEKYAIFFEDEPLVKQIFKEVGGAIRLHSYNPKYPDRLVAPDKLDFVHIVGRVIYRSG